MKNIITLLLTLLVANSLFQSLFSNTSQIPDDYKLVYQQNFNDLTSLDDFVATDKSVWKWGADGERGYIEHFSRSNYKYKVRSPYNIALIKKIEVKDFILDVKLHQTGKEYGHRDMCVFYNFKDRSNFYYTHIASVTDKNAHNCFIVCDEPRLKISYQTSKGYNWSGRKWHDLHLIRENKSGEIDVYVNDFSKPIMRAIDKTFDWGRIGFGSFDDTGRISTIKLYAPRFRLKNAKDPFTKGRPSTTNK